MPTPHATLPLRQVLLCGAIIVTLFLGGPAGPTFFGPDWIWGPVWFLAKLAVFLFTWVWFRATLPRFRYDQLMALEGAYWRLYQAQQRQAESEGAVLGGVVQEEVKA